ncbi:hypothetical protein ABB37_01837 [Leptomonas pyrrhocoris]|uniref:Uncharacterized protein n=1 Tax=Leptomonas pyrrhocoris TaxID=157538 RepID=A0A0N0DZR5_LEPPY|nr:hypothetical protein ABB37_01837 [Leptomonas pyrrhocoris]KPA85575.1 hypothetical protein ABB37_01837 [Leptomonas pyrrhocoris]|eukprot:XP_015664014.1 hypothetical protein ABB37_01837 [Leptomonas pyrrhocoris]
MSQDPSLVESPPDVSGDAGQLRTVPLLLPSQLFLEALSCGDARRIRQELVGCPYTKCTWCDSDKNTLLHYAAALDAPECLIELLQSRVDFTFSRNAQGQTPLHVASRCARTIIFVLLLVTKYGATTALDNQGNTFVHILLANTLIQEDQLVLVMESLLARSSVANLVNAANGDGCTLYDVAFRWHRRNASLLQLLMRHDAVSGALLINDEVETITAAEREEREEVQMQQEHAYAQIDIAAQAHGEMIRSHRHQRRKLAEKEKRKRSALLDKESVAAQNLWKKAADDCRRVAERQAAEEHSALILQRIGTGFASRRALYRLTVQRREECAAAQKDTARPTAAEQDEAVRIAFTRHVEAARESAAEQEAVPIRTAAEREAQNMRKGDVNAPQNRFKTEGRKESEAAEPCHSASSSGAVALQISQLPEKLLVYIQSVVRMRRQRRMFIQLRRRIVQIQRAWRWHHAQVLQRLQKAADTLLGELRRYELREARSTYVEWHTVARIKAMLREITRLVTKLVWRENFCSAFRDIVFLQRRRAIVPPTRLSRFQRLQLLSRKVEPFVLLAQVVVSVFLLVYMGCIPRTSVTKVHNKVDIAFICVQIVISCCLPLCWWRIWDFAVEATALVCAAASHYGGAIVITFFVLKIPFVARTFAPRHSGTRTYCRAIEYSTVYLLMFLPFGIAGIGATVRGTTLNRQLLTSQGNWGSVLLYLLSTVSPQYTVMLLLTAGLAQNSDYEFLMPLRLQVSEFKLANGEELLRFRMPLVQLVFFQAVLLLYTWTAVAVGMHNAIHHHYDLSDETKLKLNKNRFRNEGKEELFDAHRAANIEALGQQLDGVMWEDDVRAAKEAVDASHYDHNTNFTVHRFVRRVQDTLGNSNNTAPNGQGRLYMKSVQRVNVKPKWDCRNEDPQSRGSYDIEVIETALGMVEQRSFGERIVKRQWTGALLRKEMNLVICGMLVMASVKPNLYAMEAAFSAVFAVELLASLYFLRIEFIFSHYVRLVLRIFCVVVGFVPQAVPFVAFRCLRLVEGWSLLFSIPGMVRWALVYIVISFVTIWMIAYVAALQMLSLSQVSAHRSICSSRGECLAVSIRELVLPAFTPEHIAPAVETPVIAMLVFFTHFCFIPFVLAIVLHPLLRLSNFIGRFLRLVVQSLHKDVVDYLENYLEGASWYTHWGLRSDVSVDIIVRLKMWLNDLRRRRITVLWLSAQNSLITNFCIPQKTFVKGYEAAPEEEGNTVLTEIICRGEFATFEENSALDGSKQRAAALLPVRFVIRNVYVHYANVVLTFASIAFLWVADASQERWDARVIVSTVIHVVSILVSLAVIPRDSTAVMTLVSAAALLSAVVLILIPGRRYRGHYCLRFLSLLRVGQLQVFPFRGTRRLVKMYIDSAVKILFPVAAIGGASYIAELLRAQVFMVKFDARPWEWVNWSDTTEVAALRANVSYEVFLAAMPRHHASRPNVQQTSDLFSTYFHEDAYIFYSIFSFWVLPAICISTCLSYLFWVGANLRDTNLLMVNMIPLWEDPITTAGFSWYQWVYRYVGNVVLLASLVFGCVFSPTTTATSNDLHLFFGFEVGFTLCGLAEAILSSSFAVHRCGRSSVSWMTCEQHAKHSRVLFGDCVFLLCEIIQLLYYCIAIALCTTLLVEHDGCLVSPGEYATYFITLRFVFLLRMLSRELLLSLLRRVLSMGFGLAGIVVFFVGSASALADAYTAATQVPFTAATWRAAFDTILRLTFTSAIPSHFDRHWVPFNATAAALAMQNNSVVIYVVDQNFTASRLAFVLSAFGKAILSSIAGLVIGSVAVPVRSYFLQPLPAKSLLLYRTLCGGLPELVKFGMHNHDDMRPQARRRIQARKFARLFTPQGIPSWALPHLLEELDICRPVRQRRFMYALARLLEYLPTAEKRHRRVREYMRMWDTYRSGGPAHLLFSELPVYPPAAMANTALNPYAAATAAVAGAAHKDARTPRYVAPLRLVQALAIFELGFPADSSVGSKLWMDFFSVVQKMRGATLLQSLWRMYREEKVFDADPLRNRYERALIAYLRRSFRKHRIRSNIRFLSFATFQEAIKYERENFNPNTGHYDVINRLRGHFNKLQASNDFWKQWRAEELKKASRTQP